MQEACAGLACSVRMEQRNHPLHLQLDHDALPCESLRRDPSTHLRASYRMMFQRIATWEYSVGRLASTLQCHPS